MRTLSLADAVALIPDGASLMIGGFMAVGTPERVIDEIVRQKKRDLTVIATIRPRRAGASASSSAQSSCARRSSATSASTRKRSGRCWPANWSAILSRKAR